MSDKICSVEGCGRPAYCRTLCNAHYQRKLKEEGRGCYGRKCEVDGCDNIADKGHLCHICWYRQHRKLQRLMPCDGNLKHEYPREYGSWAAMKQRCYNPRTKGYRHYGGRGIKVCGRWLNKPYGFKNFLDDMGPKPEPKYSIDRIDVNGDYCPENCRWADDHTQAANQRREKQYSKRISVSFVDTHHGYTYWTAKIIYKGKIYERCVHSEEEAIKCREEMELHFLGRLLQ